MYHILGYKVSLSHSYFPEGQEFFYIKHLWCQYLHMLQEPRLPYKMMKEDWVSTKRKSFTEYMVQYMWEGSGGRDTIKNQKSFTMNQI